MSITTTLGQLVIAEPVLNRLCTLRVSAKLAYDVSKLRRVVRVETEHFRTERESLIRELGVERPPTAEEAETNGGQPVMSVTPENMTAFQIRLTEIVAVPVEIVASPLMLDTLSDLLLSGDDLDMLGALVSETVETPGKKE